MSYSGNGASQISLYLHIRNPTMIYELDYDTIYNTDELEKINDTIEVFPSKYWYKNKYLLKFVSLRKIYRSEHFF